MNVEIGENMCTSVLRKYEQGAVETQQLLAPQALILLSRTSIRHSGERRVVYIFQKIDDYINFGYSRLYLACYIPRLFFIFLRSGTS